eukprot:Blabericola_migrator_1__11051@NODE_642_length_7106_cov_1724_731212_g82_i1_p9_GENE_NODE_642_length_7106_cov_1724_731212_g82_i1NODE_642_length_7106_cov_1724_731212_g82_i1_p9_ORF_typecomplete_len110_score5_91znribbon_14/PF16503_5/8_1e03znribbon_14/PF16503_5/2_8e07RecR/PF02132_15/0_0055ATP_bind_3/PF01171_20/0_13NRDD/PF13597_6/0_14_NODE_642_length_7106_cov_1724_731212_g82_i157306059
MLSQRDIVLYCYAEKLDYFSTECTYSGNAFRGHVRNLVKRLESQDPAFMLRMLDSFMDRFPRASTYNSLPVSQCQECGLPSVQDVCKTCTLVHSLDSKFISCQLKDPCR